MTFKRACYLLSALAFFCPAPSSAETASAVATPNGAGVHITHVTKLSGITRCPENVTPPGATFGIDDFKRPRWTNAGSYGGGMGTWEFKVAPENTNGLQYSAMENGACVIKTVPLSQMQEHKLYKYDLIFPSSLMPNQTKPRSTQKGGNVIGSMTGKAETKLFITYENNVPQADSIYVDGNTINFTFR